MAKSMIVCLTVDFVSAGPSDHQRRPGHKREKHQRQGAVDKIAALYFRQNSGHASGKNHHRRKPPNNPKK